MREISKRHLVLAAATGALLLGIIPTLPAFAAEVEEQSKMELLTVDQQTFETPAYIETAPATREEFTVTVFTIVQWPTADRDVSAVGDFGPRYCRGCSYDHQGDDFNPGEGTSVELVADGTVIYAGWDPFGALGETVWVQHNINGQSLVTKYGHMGAGSLQVSTGQVIKRGTILGLVGSTGQSTGAHLHFQVEIGGAPIDPMPWLLANVNVDDWNIE